MAHPDSGIPGAAIGLTPRHGGLAALSLAALGIVFGDIGTSPLYAIRECFHGAHSVHATTLNVLGVLSLIVWSLVLVVSVKYLAYVLRADHHGEGGILALTALAVPSREKQPDRWGKPLVLVGLFGAALLYGDGMITPAISVLSAVEGLEVIAPSLRPFVLPVTVAVLVGLFWLQRHGTRAVGAVFGPITAIWFLALATIGVYQILQEPRVLVALNPIWAVRFFVDNGRAGFVVLGAVFLVVTGAEAIYADLGHFGTRPIRIAWFFLVLPALLLNYFGQGALAVRDPSAVENLFFRSAPSWSLVPLVVLSTCATVIASQAVISGAFSLSRQAVMMGYLPRLKIEHTSSREVGQIYMPAVNWALMLATVGMVLAFQSSSALAAAYGIAVTSTMSITTVLAYRVVHRRWGWPFALATLVTAVFLVADLAFFGANLFKIAEGGWVPLLLAAVVLTLMTTWKTGRTLLARRISERTTPLWRFMDEVRAEHRELFLSRVPGTAIYMSSTPDVVPLALAYTTRHLRVLHDRVVILTIRTDDTPHVELAERAWVEPLGRGVWRVTGVYGFMEDPDVPELLRHVASLYPELQIDLGRATFFLGHETILASELPGMAKWREHVFALMARNATRATRFFGLPAERVVEVGAYIEI
ncbi:MAG: potassium transporter Kup [Myxococcota bacterium]